MALTFASGSAHYVNHGKGGARDNILQSTGIITIAAIIYPTSVTTANQHLLSKELATTNTNGSWVFILSNQKLQFIARRATTASFYETTNTVVVDNSVPWFVAVTFDDARAGGAGAHKARFYASRLDTPAALAALTSTETLAGSGALHTDANADLYVGLERANTGPMTGRMIRYGIYSTEQTAAQLDAFKHAYIGDVSLTNCVLLAEPHDGTGSTVQDLTSNNFDGTITGASWSSTPIGDQLMDVTSAQLFASPGNWYSDGAGSLGANHIKGSSTYVRTNRCGAYLRFPVVLGSATDDFRNLWLRVDTSGLSAIAAANAPRLRMFYHRSDYADERASVTVDLAYNANVSILRVPIATALAAGTYEIEVYFDAIDLQTPGDQWTGPAQSVKIHGIESDVSATVGTVTYHTDWLMVISDSINNGAATLGASVVRANNSAFFVGLQVMRRALRVEVCSNAFGGIGVNKGLGNNTRSSTFPAMWSSTDNEKAWDKYFGGAPIDFTNLPGRVVITLGLNDNGGADFTAADLTALIDDIRTTVGSSAKIHVVPYPIFGASADTVHGKMEDAVAAAAQQAGTYYLDRDFSLYAANVSVTAVYSDDNGAGSSHPNKYGSQIYGAMRAAAMLEAEAAASAGGGLLMNPGLTGRLV